MISKIKNYQLDLIEDKSQKMQKPNSVSCLVIPLIFCKSENSEGKRLCLKELNAVKDDLRSENVCLAKLIIQGGKHILKLDEELMGLDYDEISYQYEREGKKVEKLHKKGSRSIKKMDDEETAAILELVREKLLKNSLSSHETEDSDTKPHLSGQSVFHLSISEIFEQLANFVSTNAALVRFRGDRKQQDQERKLDEKAMIFSDQRKRAEKRREDRWKRRQQFFYVKDQERFDKFKSDLLTKKTESETVST